MSPRPALAPPSTSGSPCATRACRARWLCAVAALTCGLVGCESEGDAASVPGPYAELVESGLARFVDLDEAVQVASSVPEEVSVTSWTWAHDPAGASPGCMRGKPYSVSIRDSDDPAGRDNLVLFLQGGGACWSDFCLAFDTAPKVIPTLDILRSDLPANPVRTWNLVYLPYCDGSLFTGDARHDDDGDGAIDRDHRGLRNLSAAFSLARKRFPKPKRILLAGASGGGYGLVLGLPLARVLWPDAELLVMNDSGVGVAKQGDEAFLTQLLTEFGALGLVPKSCESCLVSGHLTELIAWGLTQDPTVRMAAFSSTRDFVIANLFLQVEAEDFEGWLRTETGALQTRFPGRYAAFLTEGNMHTTLLGDIAGFAAKDASAPSGDSGGIDLSALNAFLGGLETTQTGDVAFADWLRAFVDGSDAWVPVAP